MSDLRVGVIGLGSMGRHHVRNVRQTPGLELVALADPGGDRHSVAGSQVVVASVQEVVEQGIDAAIVAVPTIDHLEIGMYLAENNVHTLIEKPLAHDLESGKKLAVAFNQAEVIGAVGYVERCNPALLEMRRRIEAGQLGEVYQISTRRQGPFPARISDVGVVKDLATHDIDLAAWVVGSNYANIYARTARKSGREFEDLLVMSGVLENGVLVNHMVNWYSPFKERLTVVAGEKGTLVADTMNADLTFFANGTQSVDWDQLALVRGVSEGEVTRYALNKREPLRVEQENFRDAITSSGTHYVSMTQACRTLEVVEAALESAASGLAIDIDGHLG